MKGYRTLAFNIVNAVMLILSLPEVGDVIPAAWLPWHALMIVVGNSLLRFLTTTPVLKKE